MTWRNFVKTTPEVLRVSRVESPPDTLLKTLKTLKTPEPETKTAPREILIIRDAPGKEIGFELDGPPTQPGTPTLEPAHMAGFAADGWTERISQAMQQVANADQGALAHCREHHHDLHRQCLESARRVDDAFGVGDADALQNALTKFEDTHRRAREFFLGGNSMTAMCGDCQNYERNQKNPAEGAGRCSAGKTPPFPYPRAGRLCSAYQAIKQ